MGAAPELICPQNNVILNSTTELIGYYDTDFNIKWFNKAARDSVGLEAKAPQEGVRPDERRTGLATVYGIVKQNKGLITVDSAPGEGAVFTVFLPVYQREA